MQSQTPQDLLFLSGCNYSLDDSDRKYGFFGRGHCPNSERFRILPRIMQVRGTGRGFKLWPRKRPTVDRSKHSETRNTAKRFDGVGRRSQEHPD
jgi:hypothetical protein